MRVEMRKTGNGTEFWDTKEKRTVFVPNGVEPIFEVTVNPESMLDRTDKQPNENEQTEIFIEDMTAKELRAYAAENEITIPFEIKKTEDIRKFLLDYEEQEEPTE